MKEQGEWSGIETKIRVERVGVWEAEVEQRKVNVGRKGRVGLSEGYQGRSIEGQ